MYFSLNTLFIALVKKIRVIVMFLLFCLLIILFLVCALDSAENMKSPRRRALKNGLPAPGDLYRDLDVYIINLSETYEGRRRWRVIQNMPHRLFQNPRRFPAYYGKTYNYRDEIEKGIITDSWNIGKWKGGADKWIMMDRGEIGVSLSHYFLWKKIASSQRHCIVLEDDAIDLHSHFDERLESFISVVPYDWDIFLLGFWLHRGDDGLRVNDDIVRVKNFVLMHAYILHPRGARKLMALAPIDMPIDSWISKHSNTLKIYRHTMKNQHDHSTLIKQKRRFKQIANTNNW